MKARKGWHLPRVRLTGSRSEHVVCGYTIYADSSQVPGIVAPGTSEEDDAAKSVDDETAELERICEAQGIALDGKPDGPPGDRCVPRFGERGEGYFIVWCLRSELIRMRAAYFRKQMATMPGIGVL